MTSIPLTSDIMAWGHNSLVFKYLKIIGVIV